jgi:hypothetical protein
VLIRRDEVSEIITNMTRNLHMNTPEQTINGVDMDDFDDNSYETRLSNKPKLIEQLQTQLIHNQKRRTQARDYLRILNESNTPAYWYKVPPKNRSVYFYDPNYQKQVQQRSNLPQKIKPNTRVRNQLNFFIFYNTFTSYFSQFLSNHYDFKNVHLIIQILFKIVLFHLHLVQNI